MSIIVVVGNVVVGNVVVVGVVVVVVVFSLLSLTLALFFKNPLLPPPFSNSAL